MTENNATLESILRTVRRIEDHQASMDSDMEKDRQDIQNLSIKLGEVVGQMEQLRRATNLSAERTRDKVAEAVEPVINSTDRLTTQIQKKKMVVLKQPKSWLSRFLGR
jgi:hypothetical protein